MSDVSLRDRLIAYALIPLSPPRVRRLLAAFDPLSTIRGVAAADLEPLLSIDKATAETLVDPWRNDELRRRVESHRATVVTLADDAYPAPLRQLPDPPLALFHRGDFALAQKPAIAVVGSRRVSAYGISAAEQIARELAVAGIVVVSGLAEGVDAAAHRAALDAGGTTVAVLGTGIDLVYPRRNRKLAQMIEERGLLLTEFPPGTPPFRHNFPVRNRIISGLTLGVVVVEAHSRSGSLITARMALEQNREVFAVPGSIYAPGSEGTNRLIQHGAKLVQTVDDIFDELPAKLRPVRIDSSAPPAPLDALLTAFPLGEATHIDSVAEAVATSVADLAEPLFQLELGGWLRASAGGRYVRVR